ncbi:MAG: hypothetical protein EHM21_11745, partial [Chloroflexi bacterium]
MTETGSTHPTPRRGNPFAWFVVALTLILAAGYIFFSLRNGHFDWTLLAFAGFPLTGALIIYRQPRNRVGWMLSVFGVFNLLSNASIEYAYFGLVTMPDSLPFCDFFSWVGSWCWMVAQPFAIASILLFPDGNPPSRRWWVLLWVVFAALLPIMIYAMILLWPFRGARLVQLDYEAAFSPEIWQLILRALSIYNPVYLGGMALAVIGMAVRFKRSSGIERQQLKWIFFAMITVPVSIAINSFVVPDRLPVLATIGQILNAASIIGFPIAVAFAVTRYHLYDIDVIIRRTLLYGALTVTLSLLYFGSVILLQAILSGITGG